MLTGENGILTQAQNAKNKTEEAEAKERQDLEDQNALIESLASGNNNIKEYHNGVPIPRGFYYVGGEKDTGLVISDIEGDDLDNSKHGNQFVWVPVDDINDMAQCETAGGDCNLQLVDGVLKCTNEAHSSTAEKIVGKLWATTTGESFGTENTDYKPNEGLREPAIVTGNSEGTGTNYDNNKDYNNGLFTLDSLKNDYKTMATSVKKNGGFYIGRYEISLSTATEKEPGTSGTACSKAGVLPTSAGNTVTSMWYGLYSISKTYTVAENSVQSSMIWGSQYDAMLNWVKNGNGSDKDKITTPGIGNNSSGSVTTTGNSTYSNDSINNIRDLGGNLREWTLEADGINFRVVRGGNYRYRNSPSVRPDDNPNGTISSNGSRLTLYIK